MSIDLSLERLQRLVKHLPPYTRPTLHIAGTNGKGSVAALLTSILLNSDPSLRVGRYNSPHLVSIYDSITLDQIPVSESLYSSTRAEVEKADKEHATRLSNFELLTLTALRVFEKEMMDIVVLEVGMGGRLDATNIVPDASIAVSALTAVDLDHQAFLGETLRLIAREKAGIGRRGRPFVLGRQPHAEVVEEAQNALSSVGAHPVQALEVQTRTWDETLDGPLPPRFSLAYADATKTAFELPGPQPVSVTLPSLPDPIHTVLPLYGAHQLDNLATALTVINELLASPPPPTLHSRLNLKERITPGSVTKGIKTVNWPGRLSFHPLHISISSPPASPPSLPSHMKLKKHPLIVLADGAHNPASAETLGSYITYLIELALQSVATSQSPPPTKIAIDITYILGLSHSPPKKPVQTLSPFLPPKIPSSSEGILIDLSTSVALLQFTQPEGMPRVKPVPPSEMQAIVRELLPAAELLVSSDTVTPSSSGGGRRNIALQDALKWVAKRQDHASRHMEPGALGMGLVVLAGSLYLVADFYRLLEEGRSKVHQGGKVAIGAVSVSRDGI